MFSKAWMAAVDGLDTVTSFFDETSLSRIVKGALDKYNIIPPTFSKKVWIFISSEVLALVMNAC